MRYKRMPIEKESPEETGYNRILFNLAESSVTDIRFGELQLSLDNLPLEYIAHRGHSGLRTLIAGAANLEQQHVLITNGAAGALFIVNTALLTAADHLVVIRPNYATNIEVPVSIGCGITYINLTFEKQWRIDPVEVEAALQPNTKMISITTPHNPTGMLMTNGELHALISIAEQNNIWLLADETYRDTCFTTPYPVLATRSKKVISVSSLSKAYGLPGIRIGWLITQDAELQELFLAAKEMMYISNSALDEAVAYQFYQQKEKFAPVINEKAMKNFGILKQWLQLEKRLECVMPEGGVVCFPRFTCNSAVNTEQFYKLLLDKYQTMAGRGHWFAMPDRYMRIGFGWTDSNTFETGLNNLSKAIDDCER